MTRTPRTVLTACVALGALALTGCSADALIWGAEGAAVIQTTETLVSDLSADGRTGLLCPDADVDLGGSTDWTGLSAGEPERFVADYWDELVPLEPDWNINLENLPDGAEPGDEFPGDVFYRDTGEGLCVIDVVWSALLDEG